MDEKIRNLSDEQLEMLTQTVIDLIKRLDQVPRWAARLAVHQLHVASIMSDKELVNNVIAQYQLQHAQAKAKEEAKASSEVSR